MGAGSGAAAPVCAGTNSWIGYGGGSTYSGTYNTWAVQTQVSNWKTPAGVSKVCSLKQDARVVSGSGNVRMSLYDTSWNLICQCSSEIAVTSAGYYECAYPNLTGPCNVSPETDYKYAVTKDGDTQLHYESEAAGSGWIYGAEYTGGFPATWTTETTTALMAHGVVGVQ
jgi:hypothetical protein